MHHSIVILLSEKQFSIYSIENTRLYSYNENDLCFKSFLYVLNIFELDTIEQVYQELIERRKYGKCN